MPANTGLRRQVWESERTERSLVHLPNAIGAPSQERKGSQGLNEYLFGQRELIVVVRRRGVVVGRVVVVLIRV